MRLIADTNVDPDDYAIGRDLAYAQALPTLIDDLLFKNNLAFDRGYWSSYVYGQSWRNKYSKDFWKSHIFRVEEVLGDSLKDIHIVFITLTEENFNRIENMGRNKDKWEITNDFRKQYDLYLEVLDITTLPPHNVHLLPAFQSDETINKFFNNILQR